MRWLTMLSVVTIIALLLVLCLLTTVWAFAQLSGGQVEDTSPGLLTARLWAASTSFLVLLVFVTGALSGLLRSDARGLPRLIEGLSWGPVQASLVGTAVSTLVPLILVIRAQIGNRWTRRARLEMATYVLLLCIAQGLLLSLGFGSG